MNKKTTADPKLIRHIAMLSRIELSEKQIHSFSRQFSDILEYFDKLNELDTTGIKPLTHAIELHNVFSHDVHIHERSLTTEEALSNAPERDNNYFKVPKVLGDS